MIFEFSCDVAHIKNDLPHQLWEAITADGQANTFVTRFFHNTPSFYGNNLLKCYLSYFSPDFINHQFTLLGLILFLYGFYQLVSRKKWRFITLLLIAPLSPLFDLPSVGQIQTLVLYFPLVLTMFYGLKRLWVSFSF